MASEPVAVAVLAKAPIPGFAKMRLIPALGADGAAALASRLIDRAVATACEAGVGPEIEAREFAAIARHDRLQDAFPSIGAVDVARPQGAALQIAELVEHEQRVIAGAFVMPVPDAHLLFAVSRIHARIHVEHNASRRTAGMNLVDPLAG